MTDQQPDPPPYPRASFDQDLCPWGMVVNPKGDDE